MPRGFIFLIITLLIHGGMRTEINAVENAEQNIDQIVDDTLEPIADTAESIVFWAVPVTKDAAVPW